MKCSEFRKPKGRRSAKHLGVALFPSYEKNPSSQFHAPRGWYAVGAPRQGFGSGYESNSKRRRLLRKTSARRRAKILFTSRKNRPEQPSVAHSHSTSIPSPDE